MNKILRTLSLAAMVGCLFACGGANNSSTSSASSSVSSAETSISESVSESVEAITIALDKTTATLKITKDGGETLQLTATTNASSVTWNVDDNTIATVSDAGLVTAVKAGTATITATAGDASATCVVTVSDELPTEIIDKTIDQLVESKDDEGANAINKSFVRVTGVVDNITNTKYGNFNLVDPVSKKSIVVYGLGSAESKGTDFIWNDGALKYSSQTFESLNVKAGDDVTLVGIWYLYVPTYGGTSTWEFSGYLEKANTDVVHKYSVTAEVNDSAMGSVSLSKEEVTYGEEVEVTVTVNEGFKIATVVANGKILNTPADGIYKFNAGIDNKVVVTFVADIGDTFDGVIKTYEIKDYDAGTQYALNEEHVLDADLGVKITTSKCHFNPSNSGELRIYSSSTNDGFAVISCEKGLAGVGFVAGNKAGTLNVYGSNDGTSYSLVSGIPVEAEYNATPDIVDFPMNYKYIKIDVDGTTGNQIRVKSIALKICN